MGHTRLLTIVCAMLASIVMAWAAHAADAADEKPPEAKLEKLSAGDLNVLEARAAAARALYDAGKYAEAEVIFKELTDRFTVSRTLYRCELALSVLAQGRHEEAYSLFLESYTELVEFFDSASEKRAAGIWGAETGKIYKGDPYEQATLSLLLGILLLERGNVDNALACFKNGQLADADVAEETYQADYALLQFLESYCYRLRNQPEQAHLLAEAGMNSLLALGGEGQDREYGAPLTENFNTLVLIMSDGGPYMLRQGEYGEQRVIALANQRTNRFEVLLNGERWVDAVQGVGDINFQATTRGGREMDNVLKRHAGTKRLTREIGDTFIQDVGGVEGLAIGLVFHIFSAAMHAQADIRCWQTLPGSIHPVPLTLEPGKHRLDVHAFDGYAFSYSKVVEIDVDPTKFNVVFIFPAAAEST